MNKYEKLLGKGNIGMFWLSVFYLSILYPFILILYPRIFKSSLILKYDIIEVSGKAWVLLFCAFFVNIIYNLYKNYLKPSMSHDKKHCVSSVNNDFLEASKVVFPILIFLILISFIVGYLENILAFPKQVIDRFGYYIVLLSLFVPLYIKEKYYDIRLKRNGIIAKAMIDSNNLVNIQGNTFKVKPFYYCFNQYSIPKNREVKIIYDPINPRIFKIFK